MRPPQVLVVDFEDAATPVARKTQAIRLTSVPPQPNPVLQSTLKNSATSGKLSTMTMPHPVVLAARAGGGKDRLP